jgi:hypothetical protein
MKQKFLLSCFVFLLIFFQILCSDAYFSTLAAPKKKTKKLNCTHNFLTKLTCNWMKKDAQFKRQKYSGFDCKYQIMKSLREGKASCPAARSNLFERFKNSLQIIKHFKTNAVDKILKKGDAKIQKQMHIEAKVGLRKKSSSILLNGLKTCNIIPEMLRLKLENFLENAPDNEDLGPSRGPKVLSLEEFILRFVRALVRGNTLGKVKVKSPPKNSKTQNEAKVKGSPLQNSKTSKNEMKASKLLNKAQIQQQVTCQCGGPCDGDTEAAEYLVQTIYQYKPTKTLVHSAKTQSPQQTKKTPPPARAGSGLGDFLKNNVLDKVEMARMRSRK